MQENEDNAPIDAFLSYRKGETRVAEINDWLKRRGVRTHYVHDIVDLGERIDEARALQEARCMVVFLGDRRWGETQQQQVLEFQAAERRILPVLIGNSLEAALQRQASLGAVWRVASLAAKPSQCLNCSVRIGRHDASKCFVVSKQQRSAGDRHFLKFGDGAR